MPVIFSVLSSPQLSGRQLSLGMLWVTVSPWAWLVGGVGSVWLPAGRQLHVLDRAPEVARREGLRLERAYRGRPDPDGVVEARKARARAARVDEAQVPQAFGQAGGEHRLEAPVELQRRGAHRERVE